ncbi:MAG: HAMP domain-containing histidine kinase [Acidobacteria bacterium]|nr:HAMP domain-containing histidine kinase [Acidobacteriota bacterium]
MKHFYFRLFSIVLVSALVITGLVFWLNRVYRELEMNPLRYEGFRHYLVHRVLEAVEYRQESDLLEISNDFRFYIQLTGPQNSLITHPDYFDSDEFTGLQKGEIPSDRDREHRGSRNRRPPREAPELRPDVKGLYENDVLQGLEIKYGVISCFLVRQPPDFWKRVFFYSLILSIFLVFLGLAVTVKLWFVDPLNRLEKAISAFPAELDSGEFHSQEGSLRQLFKTFHEMKKQVTTLMEDKERLLRDVSHDLKSPITRMRMAVELLDESKVKKMLLNDLGDLSVMVTKILESRQGKIIRNQLLDAAVCIERFRGSREFAIPIRLDVAADFRFEGNEYQLARVFRNLIENSEKYADPGKGIDIEISRQDQHGFIVFSDFGSHITDEEIEKIFEPFYKSDQARRQDSRNGYGLGLSICKQIIEVMGGQINAGRSAGAGLSIELVFPIAETNEVETASPHSSQ